jgi:oxazoline/thiazoline synthase
MPSPTTPVAFRHRFTPLVVPGEAVYLISEQGVSLVRGRLAEALAPLLDGTRSVADIAAELDGVASPQRVADAVGKLVAGGWAYHLDQIGEPAVDPATAGFFETAGQDGDRATRAVREGRVHLVVHGDVDAVPLRAALAELGVGQLTAAPHPAPDEALVVVLTDDYLRAGIADQNVLALATGRPWLLARPVGVAVWLGPVFVPGETGCWECMAHRLSANRLSSSYLQQRLNRAEPLAGVTAQLAVTPALAARLTAIEVAKALAGVRTAPAAVVTFDTMTLASDRHELIRRPQCAACGDPTMQERQGYEPVRFRPRRKTFTADGGHRTATPEETLDRYRRQVSPITGVVTQLVPGGNLPDGLHVYVSGQNLARQAIDLTTLRSGLRNTSCGKGTTAVQAKVGAVAEAIERYSGVYRGDEPRRLARLADLGEAAVHPGDCMLFSERQYQERARWNALGQPFAKVPARFDETAERDWSPVWSVTGDRLRWLPTEYLYYHYLVPGPSTAPPDSNGNAAGSSLEDAALQGFLELVERDAVALWWYNRLRRPAIDLDSFADPYIDRLLDIYADLHREVWALDITSDLGIPVVAALSRRTDKDAQDILLAFGAHLDPRIALMRALTEMNQFVGSAQPDEQGRYPGNDPAQAHWWRTATVAGHPYLLPSGGEPATPARWPSLATDDLAADLDLSRRLVEDRGMELLVLDQTRPDIGLPVVKVIVPGLRHFWSRFAPGRLYDVPVELGWLDRPTAEAELNPIPMFI